MLTVVVWVMFENGDLESLDLTFPENPTDEQLERSVRCTIIGDVHSYSWVRARRSDFE